MYQLFSNKNPLTISIIPGTAGYDIHYQFDLNCLEQAKQLMSKTIEYIKTYQTSEMCVFISGIKLFERPVGPWRKPMWQIQLNPIDPATNPYDKTALEENKLKSTQQFMLMVVSYMKKEIETNAMSGSLLVHAYPWPNNADQFLEYQVHFEHAWLVLGPSIDLKDIWHGEKGLIAMEKYIKTQLTNSVSNELIRDGFKNQFGADSISTCDKLLAVQKHMLENSVKLTSTTSLL